MRRPVRRRRVTAVIALLAAAAAAAAIAGLVSVDRHGASVLRFTIHSRYVHAVLPEVAVLPPHSGGAGRPLLVFLHGKGSDGQESNLGSAMFAALAAQGSRAPDIVFPNGGEDSYWHNRRGGAWASYVMREVIPRALALTGADRRRIAIGGISMGGFGALDLARTHPGRFCAVGGHSAALWFTGADSASGAFDDAVDFSRHDLIGSARGRNLFGTTPVWMDVGSDDPFRAADSALATELRRAGARLRFSPGVGGHDGGYWNSRWGAYMRFYARSLAACPAG
jgi:S-formylglutathione hydrolase FrmB